MDFNKGHGTHLLSVNWAFPGGSGPEQRECVVISATSAKSSRFAHACVFLNMQTHWCHL